MKWPEIYLICFGIGTLWTLASLLLGSLHLGHTGHAAHAHVPHAHAGHGAVIRSGPASSGQNLPSWLGTMINPSCAAVFLAWFGGVGYLLTRHTGLTFWINLTIAIVLGFVGALILAAFLRFLQRHEKPLDPGDYDMIGVLGRVSSFIRSGGVGEVIYVRDGARRPIGARSEDGTEIKRGEEVIVTRYEKGIAYVRTWDAMNQPRAGEQFGNRDAGNIAKEIKHVD